MLGETYSKATAKNLNFINGFVIGTISGTGLIPKLFGIYC